MGKINGVPESTEYMYGYGYPEQYIHDVATFKNYIYIVTGTHGLVLRSADADWNIVLDTSYSNLYAIGITTDISGLPVMEPMLSFFKWNFMGNRWFSWSY